MGLFCKIVFILVLTFFTSFSTISAQSPSFSFGAAGDFANGSSFQSVVNQASTNNLNFFLGLGDFSYSAGSEQNWCGKWNAAFRNILLIAGNHDTGESSGGNISNYIQHCNFRLPNIIGNYGHQYYFDYPEINPIARFIMIRPGVGGAGSISYSNGSAGYIFTQNAIDDAKTRSIPWIIIGMHKNYISVMEKSNEIGTDLISMLLQRKVDVILQGHEHGYERSKQLTCATPNSFSQSCVADSDNNFLKGAGTVIQVIGTGGQSLRSVDTADPEYPYFSAVDITTKGFGKFTINQNQLSFNFVRSEGGSFSDSYIISKPAPTSPPSSPKPGDANLDNVVDGRDYVVWLNNFGTTHTNGAARADFNFDRIVDGRDYVMWLNNFGR